MNSQNETKVAATKNRQKMTRGIGETITMAVVN